MRISLSQMPSLLTERSSFQNGIPIVGPELVSSGVSNAGRTRTLKVNADKDLFGERCDLLKQILSEFLRLDGVSAAVVVGRDGFVIESAVSGKIDIEALGAMASTGVGTSEAMGTELGKGQLTQMLVETEKGPILLSPLSVDELIAIVADNATVIGRIRYDLKKNRERIIAAL
jgi:predicted regulator of Ras-like GTPase activity (Roadblock/LC7/MglB family)